MSINQITSDSRLSNTEHHFRVAAGPGAGKTHWLVNHIKNVLQDSARLGKTRKIACITYTNIAVETILGRLGTSAGQVEVSTIHSFLYNHVVKPYASFIAKDYGLDVTKMDGHDEINVSIKKMINWIEQHSNASKLSHPYTVNQLTKLENNKQAINRWLASLSYKFSSSNKLLIVSNRSDAFYIESNTRKYIGKVCLDKLETDFLSFKKQYWQEGALHHDDVLFFSYQIIQKFPFVLDVLRTKFPYFFIDEFQDSSPIQVAVLKLIGQKETIVGVIGDKAQSIYGFQGAEPLQFTSFSLAHLVDYAMVDNRRSTDEVIDILNHIRSGDIQQDKWRNAKGEKPVLFVGDKVASLRKTKEICGRELVYSLSRDNITSNEMKKEIGGIILNNKLFDSLLEKDAPNSGNKYRSKVIIACIKAVELSREKKFKDAIKELEKIFKEKDDKEKGKREAIRFIRLLASSYNDFNDKSLFVFFQFVKNKIKPDISDLRNGTAKTFYDSHTYQQLALCVKIAEDVSQHKTIHKAKGDEFDNVLLILKGEADLAFLTNPDLTKEEHRVNYVAVSRAKNRLFISVPSLDYSIEKQLEMKVKIIHL